MKKLFIICSLILAAAFFKSCEKETIFLPENESDQYLGKENLSARVLSVISAGELYALNPYNTPDNITVFSYDPSTDDLVLNEGIGSTGFYYNFGFDFNNEDGLIYLLASDDKNNRNLYTWNKETNETVLIEQIISVENNYSPIDLTFGNDGTLYFVFSNGEINSYNVTTNMMSAFSTITTTYFGAVGLTYNFDSNQLVCGKAYSALSPAVELFSIDIPTGNVTTLFIFISTDNSLGNGQAIEYVGNDKLLASGTYENNAICTVDLVTQETNVLLSPTGVFLNIKDLMFIIPNSDSDADGLLDFEDNCPLTANTDQTDTDADGVGDVCDVCPGSDDSLDTDSDGIPDGCDLDDSDEDGVLDYEDNCPLIANADQADTDGDGIGDACDNCPYISYEDQADSDFDGIGDACDNCQDTSNANQVDSDLDSIGDVCDNCPETPNTAQLDSDLDGIGDACHIADTDGDGVSDDVDNCPNSANENQYDNDDDGIGDVCDTDDDNDGVPDVADNCPTMENADQEDNDNDNIGDVCDDDDDNDTKLDNDDNCELISNFDQANNDFDDAGDVCDDDDDNDTVIDTADNCPKIENPLQEDIDDDGIGDACDNDSDNDGCIDADDSIDASNMEATVYIDNCNTGVTNKETSTCGIMMSDRIDALEAATYTKKDTFIKAVTKLTTEWLLGGLITKAEKNLILKCAKNASI